MMETVDINSTPTTPQKGDAPATQNEVPKQGEVILNDTPGSDIPNGTLKGDDKFNDPVTTTSSSGGADGVTPAAAAEVERAPTPPPLRPSGTTNDDKSLAEKWIQSTLELGVTQKLFKTYDGVAEKFGAPNVEKIGSDIMEVHEQWKGEGLVAATKTATTKYIGHTKTVTKTTYEKTKQVTSDSWQKVSETTTNLTNKGLETAKPYLDRVAENPQVDRVVGSVRSASVGAGSMVTTIAASVTEQTKQNLDTAQRSLDTLRGYTPEYAAKLASEEEAWRQVLKSGSGGEELHVPARQELTTSHFVKNGSVLTWKFRVQSHDIGFAVRLRVQGDGGSTEVDVFANQKYSSGVTVQGEWSPSTDSALIIVWDNAYSYLREKVVAFQSTVKRLEDHIADQEAEERSKREIEKNQAQSVGGITVVNEATLSPEQAETVVNAAEASPPDVTDDGAEETLVFGNSNQDEVMSPATNDKANMPVDEGSTPTTTSASEEGNVGKEEKEKDADY